MRIVCLSDTHTMGRRVTVPDGDVLIHAGDHTLRGTESEMIPALEWLDSLPHRRKVFIAGNHDWFLDENAPLGFRTWDLRRWSSIEDMLKRFPALTYLQDSAATIDGVKFYGSPWQPRFQNWAFNFPAEPSPLPQEVWEKVPADTEVLITHTPPFGYLDKVLPGDTRVGCSILRKRLRKLKNLKLNVFGHIHEGYGQTSDRGIAFVNASICTRRYNPTNAPIVIDL